MRYVSTRGEAPALDLEGVVLQGLAPDGGLYVPERWPRLTPDQLRGFRGRPYAEVAAEVLAPFFVPSVDAATLRALTTQAYAAFDHPEVAPLQPLDDRTWILELFHGPTLAFKDVALQLLGHLFDHLLSRRGARATVLGATSGDTGSAAIEGCRGRDALDIFILHPRGGPSEVQRRQMTTVLDPNVFNVAVEGTFDDCQDLVKALFRDPDARRDLGLTAVNSINQARVLAQVVYYVTAAVALGAPDREVAFTVPTGNFGDVLAGWCARRMGVPIRRLVVATNRNDLLVRALATGRYAPAQVAPSLSPSMDIQVSSNFERLLFEEGGRDPAPVRAAMEALATERAFAIAPDTLSRIRAVFDAVAVDDAATLDVIRDVHARTGRLLDPHTAVGVGAAARVAREPDVPMVVLATAHPSKFPEAVSRATGVVPPLPPHLADLPTREERCAVLPADRRAVERFVRERARITHAR